MAIFFDAGYFDEGTTAHRNLFGAKSRFHRDRFLSVPKLSTPGERQVIGLHSPSRPGKANCDARAPAYCALDVKRAAMKFNETLGQRKSEPRSLVFSLQPIVDLAKGGQRYLDVLRRHSNSRVGNANSHFCFILL